MPLLQSKLDHFYGYACWMIENRNIDSLDEALVGFRKEQEASLEAIREGLADIEAGRTRPADEVFEELRQEFGLRERPRSS